MQAIIKTSCCWCVHHLLILLFAASAAQSSSAVVSCFFGAAADRVKETIAVPPHRYMLIIINDREASTESLKESIKALYMNMDVPEVSPTDTSGALNVSIEIGEVARLANNEIDVSFTLHLRWGHRFLDMMSDSLEAIPLNRDKLWTPKFVFVNARSLREEQNSLSMKLAGGLTAKAIVYRVWHRATVRCDGPALQYPLADTLCSIVFEEANPRGQRSVHMSLSQHHQHNCSAKEAAGRHAIVYRLSKPISGDGRKYQFWTRLCIKSSLDDMSGALRQYCLSLILLLHSFATLYFFDRTTRLLINLALLHILLLNWQPVVGSRISALDIWLAKCTLVIFCCLTVAMATTNEPGNGEGGFGDGGTRRKRRQQQRDEQLSGRQSVKGSSGSYSGTFLMQRDPQTSSSGLRNSKCTTISECSDHLDLFPPDEVAHHHHSPAQLARSETSGGRGSPWQTLAKTAVPACWLLMAAAFWACALLTADRCESLLPECHRR